MGIDTAAIEAENQMGETSTSIMLKNLCDKVSLLNGGVSMDLG